MYKIAVIILFLCSSCFICTQVSSAVETLTDSEIRELGYKLKTEDTIFMKDGKLDIAKLEKVGNATGSSKYLSYEYVFFLEDGSQVVIEGDGEVGYSKTIVEKGNSFKRFYGYYPSGDIKNTGQTYLKGFSSGIRYYFDEGGEIERYEDFDAPYTFSWEQVVAFLKEHKITEEQIINIHRGNSSGIYRWSIIYKPEELKGTDDAKVIYLNGKTGEIIGTRIKSLARELD